MNAAKPQASLRRRLLATLLVVLLPALVALTGGLFLLVCSSVWSRFDADLLDLAGTLADLVDYEDAGYEFELGPEPEGLTAGEGHVTYMQLWGPDGETLSRTPALGGVELPTGGPRGTIEDCVLDDGRVLRLVTLEFTPDLEEDAPATVTTIQPVTLVVARETTTTVQMLTQLGIWFIGLVVVTLGAAVIACGWAVRRGLWPVHAIADEIERIDAGALSQRLDARLLPTEIRPIVRTTNALLDRLERAFTHERQLTADVAHELRTPLGVLQTSLELGLRRERTNAEYHALLGQALADVRQLVRLVGNLLELARLEGAQPPSRVEEILLRPLIEERWSEHSPLASQRRLSFHCEVPTSVRVHSDRDKLAVIVSNLLANAAQYTEVGGWIRIESRPDEGLVLAVVDSGPALPPEQLEHVFERFWRADPARSEAGMHCGIGLALVRSLAQALGLSAEAEVRADGSLAFAVRDPAPGSARR
jgi:heavy metal sensor kinase